MNIQGERKIFINDEVEKIKNKRKEGPVQIKQDQLRNVEKELSIISDEVKELSDEFKDNEKEIKDKKKNMTE